jgi:hypothetical protein
MRPDGPRQPTGKACRARRGSIACRSDAESAGRARRCLTWRCTPRAPKTGDPGWTRTSRQSDRAGVVRTFPCEAGWQQRVPTATSTVLATGTGRTSSRRESPGAAAQRAKMTASSADEAGDSILVFSAAAPPGPSSPGCQCNRACSHAHPKAQTGRIIRSTDGRVPYRPVLIDSGLADLPRAGKARKVLRHHDRGSAPGRGMKVLLFH